MREIIKMAPLLFEMYDGKSWIEAARLGPRDRPGSISDNQPGKRDVYYFGCSSDGSHSTVTRSEAGIDAEKGNIREVYSIDGTVVAVLRKGNPPYEMTITTPKGPKTKVRFSHI